MKILINRGNIQNAKSYPYWDEFIALAKDHEIKEIKGILSTQELKDLVNWSDTFVTIDSFLPHFCAYHKLKYGVVLWGKSNPDLFGYKHNINLHNNRFRKDQFLWWVGVPHEKEDFVKPDIILQNLQSML